VKQILLLTLLFGLPLAGRLCAAQELDQPATFAYILRNAEGVPLQYSIQLGATLDFSASKQRKRYKFTNAPNSLEIQTVAGVTELSALNSTNGGCASGGCSYLGTFGELSMQTITRSDGSSYIRMGGDLTGTFTDAAGNVYPHTVAHYYIETYPATDGVAVGAVGGLTIVLAYN
jgi:hypothetical protein